MVFRCVAVSIVWTHTAGLLCVFSGVEDEMALALELSRREGQPHQSSQNPQIQNRLTGVSDRSHESPYSAPAQRSFSAAPFYPYGNTTKEDEEDEDLQLALACSLSEMEAQQRAGATDFISGAGDKGRAKPGEIANGKHLNLSNGHKIVAGGQDDGSQLKVGSGPADNSKTKRTREPALSSESSSTASTKLPSSYSEEILQPAAKNSSGTFKKKTCGCVVC